MAKQDYTAASAALQRQASAEDEPRALLQRHTAFLNARSNRIAQWVTCGLRPEALIRFCLLDLSTSPKLLASTPESVYLALLACAQTGLEPGALRGEAYLVPFRNSKQGGRQEAQFMIGWKGLIKQARRSKVVRGLTSEIVCERDEFDLQLGTEQRIVHRPARADRGPTIGAYAVARLDDGGHEIEWVDRDDLDKIQANAAKRGASPAWADWQDQMQRKTAIRRLCKRLPLGPDYGIAAALEQATEDGEDASKILDVFTDGEASRAGDAGRAADEIQQQTADKAS